MSKVRVALLFCKLLQHVNATSFSLPNAPLNLFSLILESNSFWLIYLQPTSL